MQFYWLVLGVLSVWRVTHLLYAEDGPWDALVHLRRRAGTGFWASLLDCFHCMSVWTAAPLAWFLGEEWKERLLLWPALSAGAILLERLTSRQSLPAQYVEDEEQDEHLLRRQEDPVPQKNFTATES